MARETDKLPNRGRQYQRPSERTARFILHVCGWLKDIMHAPSTTVPRGRVEHHQGKYLATGKTLRYPHILLVEDNPGSANEFIEAIRNHYVFGAVKILVAHAYDAAVSFFDTEDVDLVIMDADLDDEDGDGADLTQKFVGQRPNIIILANSSSRISNLKLTGCGAADTLGKSREKLLDWLMANDPTGSDG